MIDGSLTRRIFSSIILTQRDLSLDIRKHVSDSSTRDPMIGFSDILLERISKPYLGPARVATIDLVGLESLGQVDGGASDANPIELGVFTWITDKEFAEFKLLRNVREYFTRGVGSRTRSVRARSYK